MLDGILVLAPWTIMVHRSSRILPFLQLLTRVIGQAPFRRAEMEASSSEGKARGGEGEVKNAGRANSGKKKAGEGEGM